jgi:uncharacterized protein YukE
MESKTALSEILQALDERFNKLDERFNEKLNKLEQGFNDKFHTLEQGFNDKFHTLQQGFHTLQQGFHTLQREVEDVKVSTRYIRDRMDDQDRIAGDNVVTPQRLSRNQKESSKSDAVASATHAPNVWSEVFPCWPKSSPSSASQPLLRQSQTRVTLA